MSTHEDDEESESVESSPIPIIAYITLIGFGAVFGLFFAFELNTWQIVVLPLVPPMFVVVYVVLFLMD